MKTQIILFLGVLTMFSCKEKPVVKEEVYKSIITMDEVLAQKDKVITCLKELAKKYSRDSFEYPQGYYGYHQILSDIDDFEITFYRYVELDEDKFLKDATPENLYKCLYSPDNKFAITAKGKDGSIFKMRIDGNEPDKTPCISSFEWEKDFKWLEEMIEKSDDQECLFFGFYGREYFVVLNNGIPTYYTVPRGEPGPYSLCNYISKSIKNRRNGTMIIG